MVEIAFCSEVGDAAVKYSSFVVVVGVAVKDSSIVVVVGVIEMDRVLGD